MLKIIGVALKGDAAAPDRRDVLAAELRRRDLHVTRRAVSCYLQYLDRYSSRRVTAVRG